MQYVEIYKVHTAHSRFGNNWGSYKVSARNADEALRKAKRKYIRGERLQSLELLASTR
jgi:hypothetical protein